MIEQFSQLENEIIEKLKLSGLISRFSVNEIQETVNLQVILKLFKEPVEIYCDDFGVYYMNEEGDKTYCPEMKTSISDKGEWLSDKIPNINFDIDQSGNVRKADEAEALFCAIVVANVLREDSFKDELLMIAKQYDFENMKNIEGDESQTLRSLLNDWQNLQSIIINIIISACKYRIFDFKKDGEKFLKDGISEKEVAELRDLQAKIRNINFSYSEGDLSPNKVKRLTKIEKLTLITKRDDEISAEITKSKAGVLYKILNLSSEYISPVNKKKISLWVRHEVDTLLNERKEFLGYREDRSQIISKLQRRALRFEKNSIRRLNVERYLLEKNEYKFPSKQ